MQHKHHVWKACPCQEKQGKAVQAQLSCSYRGQQLVRSCGTGDVTSGSYSPPARGQCLQQERCSELPGSKTIDVQLAGACNGCQTPAKRRASRHGNESMALRREQTDVLLRSRVIRPCSSRDGLSTRLRTTIKPPYPGRG